VVIATPARFHLGKTFLRSLAEGQGADYLPFAFNNRVAAFADHRIGFFGQSSGVCERDGARWTEPHDPSSATTPPDKNPALTAAVVNLQV
jgi:hypothetical protein